MIFYPLEKTTALCHNYKKVFKIDKLDLMLIQHEGKLSLLEATCPHAGYPMNDAKVIGSNLRCSMHGYLFDISNGECTFTTEGPCRGLKKYEIVYKNDEIGVML